MAERVIRFLPDQDEISPGELKREIESFRLISCGLRHEQVTGEKGSVLDEFGTEVSKTFTRVGLCSKELRNSVIGCAHTPANHKFIDLLKKTEFLHAGVTDLRKEFDETITQIYLLDHVKGELEKELFTLSGEDKILFQRKKEELVREHAKLQKRLFSIRQSVIETLTARIELDTTTGQ